VRSHFDIGSLVVIAMTLVLFMVALFTKGFTHDLLLEAGVFLVSVKLIIMAHKDAVVAAHMAKRLERVQSALAGLERRLDGRTPSTTDPEAAGEIRPP
jgi:hypothetical protein